VKIAFIGGGKMAEAIMSALIRGGVVDIDDVAVSDVDGGRRRELHKSLGVHVTYDSRHVVHEGDVIFLAVKPQQLDEVLDGISNSSSGKLFISIAAGKRLASIASRLPGGRVVRVMPNLAALVAESMNVFCADAIVTESDRQTVNLLLESFGRVIELEEEHFDAVTALSGSGPAFICYILNAMAEGGQALGLNDEDARMLARQTLIGTAQLLASGLYEPESLIAAVSSERGTTVAGLDVLSKTTVGADLAKTLAAAAQRSRELSK
jgi:pyrroline-5-carboxylate reductase